MWSIEFDSVKLVKKTLRSVNWLLFFVAFFMWVFFVFFGSSQFRSLFNLYALLDLSWSSIVDCFVQILIIYGLSQELIGEPP
uniref:Uncharacterized protein n=1 Tax=Rhizophora mucronata TaxID=61149 RepID=A0A2P2LYN1_RHIMU